MQCQPREQRYDLVVVGAGVIGLSCAWRAVQAGMSVLVVDRGGPGSGASGVAAGMLAPVTEADFGEEELLALNLEGRSRWPEFAAELERESGLSTGYSESGALVVAADRDDAEELGRLHAYQRGAGLDSRWIGPREARRLEPGLSPRIGGAIHAPQDGYADPQATVRALVAALQQAGAELLSGAEVLGLEIVGGRVCGVRTGAGSVVAGAVVMATGAWSGDGELAAEAEAPQVRPLKGQLLELRVRAGHQAPATRLIRTLRCYLVSRPGGRVVLGATMEEQGFDTAITVDGVFRLLEAAYEVLPDVAELELGAARAGLRPATPANLPVIGAGRIGGLVWATGHGRNGVLLAPLTGTAVAELLRSGELPEPVRPFSPGATERVASL